MKRLKYIIDNKFITAEFVEAKRVVDILLKNGFKAYFVGGCVRDIYLDLIPKDFDVVTDATPEEMKKMFRNVLTVGEQFGIVVVVHNKIETEVATFRKEDGYVDGRHPTSIDFTNEEEDVKRRDFTINALLYDFQTEEIIDYTNGIEHINSGILKAIGDPYRRFEEDKLRMLRAIRFSNRFGFNIDDNTYGAIKEYADKIGVVSVERIKDELTKIFNGNNRVQALEMLYDTKLIKYIIPEAYKFLDTPQPPQFHPEGSVYEHIKLMFKYSQQEKIDNPMFLWAVFLHDIGKPSTIWYSDRIRFNNHDYVGSKLADQICKDLKFSNKEREYIVALTRDHMKFIALDNMRLSTKKKLFRLDYIEDLILLLKLDILGSFGDLTLYNHVVEEYNIIKQEKLKPEPLIMGKDLINLGLKPSPLFSEILSKIEDMQLEHQLLSKDDAIEFVKKEYL